MDRERKTIQELEALVDALLLGKTPDKLADTESCPEDLRGLAEKLGRLSDVLGEAHGFAQNVARGNLTVDPPGRRNYWSAPLKEIHSQLISFCFSIEQLIQGNMVSKLHYPGGLYVTYNKLIDKVSQTFGNLQAEEGQWGSSVTSWRYHQILSAINQLQIMIIEVRADGTILFANPPARAVFGEMDELPYNEVSEETDELIQYLCTFSDRGEDLRPDKVMVAGFPESGEVFDSASGAWYKITSDTVKLTDGSVGLLHMIDDISEWKRHEHQLKLTASTDQLTSAYTRKAGFQKLDELIHTSAMQTNCAAFIDLDGLKTINDKYGHNEGDYAIKTVAEVLLHCVRKTDWVVRYGGDEFLVLFSNCKMPVVKTVIGRMYSRLEQINESSGKPYVISFSVGASVITPEMEKISDVVAAIDRDMYQNKLKRKKGK